MFGARLNEAANLIILLSAVIIAAKNVWAFFKQPVDEAGKRIKKAGDKKIGEILDEKLDEKLPPLLSKNCDTLMKSLNEIKNLNMSQEERLEELQASMDLINKAQMDAMRYNMNRIYYKYHTYKKILSADKKAFMKFYDDYHSMGGNTWIDSLHKELIEWEIVEDESELKT